MSAIRIRKITIALAITGSLAQAVPVAITNHSFENGSTGWSSAMGGIKEAATAGEFLYNAPDGDDVIFAFSHLHNTSQVLVATLAANTTYTLQMEFMHGDGSEGLIKSMFALGYGANGPGGDGSVQLARIGSGQAGAPVPPSDAPADRVRTWTLIYTTGESPVGLGQPLWIQLGPDGSNVYGRAGYDNVRLDAFTPGGNDYATWISGFTLVDASFNGDDDRDNLVNGLEGLFGTLPNVANPGLTQVSKSGNTVSFTHPNPNAEDVLTDVVGSYEWSLDMETWYKGNGLDGPGGTTVATAATSDHPSANVTTVAATIGGTVPTGLYLRVIATMSAPVSGIEYADWVGGFTLVDTTISGDDDGDNLSNGLEGLFGSDPSVANAGLTQVSKSGNTVTFTHPNPDAEDVLTDVTGSYEWSLDLVNWYAGNGLDGPGATTVTTAATRDNPSANVTTMVATIGGTVPAGLYLRVVATQN